MDTPAKRSRWSMAIRSASSSDLGHRRPQLIVERVMVRSLNQCSKDVDIEFHHQFHSLSGADKHGLLNVLDAFAFVFDENEGSAMPNEMHEYRGSSQVHLHFAEIIESGSDDVKCERVRTFVIGRRLHDIPEHTIDGNKASFADVMQKIKSIDPNFDAKQFLVTDNRGPSIMAMQPKAQAANESGLLEYLEDLFDTAKFREHIAVRQQLLIKDQQLAEAGAKARSLEEKLRTLEFDQDNITLNATNAIHCQRFKDVLAEINALTATLREPSTVSRCRRYINRLDEAVWAMEVNNRMRDELQATNALTRNAIADEIAGLRARIAQLKEDIVADGYLLDRFDRGPDRMAMWQDGVRASLHVIARHRHDKFMRAFGEFVAKLDEIGRALLIDVGQPSAMQLALVDANDPFGEGVRLITDSHYTHFRHFDRLVMLAFTLAGQHWKRLPFVVVNAINMPYNVGASIQQHMAIGQLIVLTEIDRPLGMARLQTDIHQHIVATVPQKTVVKSEQPVSDDSGTSDGIDTDGPD